MRTLNTHARQRAAYVVLRTRRAVSSCAVCLAASAQLRHSQRFEGTVRPNRSVRGGGENGDRPLLLLCREAARRHFHHRLAPASSSGAAAPPCMPTAAPPVASIPAVHHRRTSGPPPPDYSCHPRSPRQRAPRLQLCRAVSLPLVSSWKLVSPRRLPRRPAGTPAGREERTAPPPHPPPAAAAAGAAWRVSSA